MADNVAAGVAGHPVEANGVDAGQVGLMERHRDVDLLGSVPQDVEVRMIYGAAADPVGPHHAADEAVGDNGPLQLGRRQMRVLLR
jgi:hypothetical protein